MEVKEKYETPMMEMIGFNREEVVTMSGQGDEIPNENFVVFYSFLFSFQCPLT